MDTLKEKAAELLKDWKKDCYIFGAGAAEKAGELAARHGKTVLVAANGSAWMADMVNTVKQSLGAAGCEIVCRTEGCRPNSPYEDVFRVQREIVRQQPEVIVAVGGGSTIDGVKAAAVLAAFEGTGENPDPYFGVGTVTAAIKTAGRRPVPVIAVQCASGSGAHLTKYSNITNLKTGQKKLIIDEAIVPPGAVFDYPITCTAAADLTKDGAFDGIAHMLEVYYGAKPETIDKIEPVAVTGLELIIGSLRKAVSDPSDTGAREALGLGTDLGGYAIMIGGTNGPHLNSFSLVDVMPHGRACALLEPYYTVLFANAIGRQLKGVGAILQKHGFIPDGQAADTGRAVAEGLRNLARSVDFPTTLGEVEKFDESYISKMLTAAKDPALASKLQNMPVPMTADQVDEYMGSVLQAALDGDLGLIKPMQEIPFTFRARREFS